MGQVISRKVIPKIQMNKKRANFKSPNTVSLPVEDYKRLVESKQRLEALMDALPVGVTFSLDPKCSLIEVNPFMKEKMEMGSAAYITATNKETLISRHEYKHYKDGRLLKPRELTLQRAIAENRIVGPIEAEVELPSGKRWYAAAYGAPIRDHDGTVIGAVAVNMDLTERKKAERAEKLTLIIAQEKERLGFITDAMHELRTPVAIIRGDVELALQKRIPSKDALDAINAEVLHLTDILSDLSLLTNQERGTKRNVDSHKVDLSKIISAVAKRHVNIAAKKDILIKAAKLPQMEVTGDEYYLRRLFANIITNAISYGKESGWIDISAKIENGSAKIVVRDNGVGIGEKDLPHIFDRFYRTEESRSRDHGGSGLGLAIVKWIAEAHGGSVQATSFLDKGSAFTVTLPLANFENRKKLKQVKTRR
jgi:signal transduction histidine kinase